MSDKLKIQLSIPRKNVLLLSKVIERGLSLKDGDKESNILDIALKETMEELAENSNVLLKKTGFIEMNEKLKTF